MKNGLTTTLRITKTHLNYELVIHEVDEGLVFEDDHFSVTTKVLQHVIPCLGFRVEQKPLPGKLLMDKVNEVGVPKGPLLKQLKDGEDVDVSQMVVLSIVKT